MTKANTFHLNILQERFNDIMNTFPASRKQRAEMLMKDMEMIFQLPGSNVHPRIINLYERVQAAAL
ncbi:hypothetical protein M948_18065 [Virgibacillus sp. CM-4]|uniref:hypothetical protein n=1 Tax=Virgibacillus sp. CM-4 TaxID=1354277 RepID=UPI0003887273|nr:hypothetical protein [Virgibacillus sp. CM-4]EQB35011.1 hypothetical protein M948_18065 [Virgibacillus sp. CM-4]